MPVPQDIANGYLQLQIAGATLLILLVFVILLFRMMTKINSTESSSHSNRIDKLCDKIDHLITSYSENTQELNKVLLSNDKDQKETIKLLNTLLSTTFDIQKKVVRIDDRTYACIGSPNKEGVGQ